MPWLLLLLLWREGAKGTEDPSLDPLAHRLRDAFNANSRFPIVEKEMRMVSGHLGVKWENAEEALKRAREGLSPLFEARRHALRNMAEAAEEGIREYSSHSEILDEEGCRNQLETVDSSDVHNETNDVYERTRSGVHVNLESYKCDPDVVRDFTWTGTEAVERAMADNAEKARVKGTPIHSQMIGTYSGLTRLYPRLKWVVEPPQITLDLYDPRFRPWFVNAEAAPKDVVILIDYSGSTKGPTMHLTRTTLLYILSTLSPQDYIAGVYFSSTFNNLFHQCNNISFIPATTRNKKIFYERVVEQEEKDQAALGPPLNFSIELLRNSTSALFGDSRSGAHKIVILMTDGIDEWPYKVIEEEIVNAGDKEKVRIYGLAMGFGTGHLPLLDFLACITNATSAIVDSIYDVKYQSRSYLNDLSTVHAGTLYDIPMTERPISWSRLYMEAQGGGPVVTLSTPIVVPRTQRQWKNGSRMAGVAGIDIHIRELSRHLEHNDQFHTFLVDDNGIVIGHRDQQIPKSEAHGVRRSACYDASQVNRRTGGGVRVQYGVSDERVYRLVGLIDCIPTFDLYELEPKTKTVEDLRKAIMTRTCDDKRPIRSNESTTYRCGHIADTPYTVVVADSSVSQSVEYTRNDSAPLTLPSNPFVGFFLSARWACGWALDAVVGDWATAWASHPACRGPSLSRALARVLVGWAEQWPLPKEKATCEDQATAAMGFPSSTVYSSFVYTRGQLSAFYPNCPSKMSQKERTADFVRVMEKERLRRVDDHSLQILLRNKKYIVYKPILDENRRQYNYQSHCLVLSREALVIASSTTGDRKLNHLAMYDLELFEKLRKSGHITRADFWLWSSFGVQDSRAQPQITNGTCVFQKVDPFERCVEEHNMTIFTGIPTIQLDLNVPSCVRYANFYSIANTSLTLVVVNKPCNAPKTGEYVLSRRLKNCELIASNERRRPDFPFMTTSDYEREERTHQICAASFSPCKDTITKLKHGKLM